MLILVSDVFLSPSQENSESKANEKRALAERYSWEKIAGDITDVMLKINRHCVNYQEF